MSEIPCHLTETFDYLLALEDEIQVVSSDLGEVQFNSSNPFHFGE